jgi:phenylacetate-CoA ligase
LAFNEQVSFTIPGIRNADFVMLTTALDGSFVAGLAYYLGIKRLGASIIRAGSKNLSIQVEILKKYPVSTIIGVPSNLIKLHRYCNDEGIVIEKEKIKKLVLIGETIRNEDITLNQLGRRLSECYPEATLYSTYANTETCTSFCECSAGNGGHLHPNLAYIEVLDENDQLVPNRTAGRLVMTTFGCQGMPLLRYDTGDITFIDNEKCSCGRTTQRIGPILGRMQNILKISGTTCSQAQLENAVLSVKC